MTDELDRMSGERSAVVPERDKPLGGCLQRGRWPATLGGRMRRRSAGDDQAEGEGAAHQAPQRTTRGLRTGISQVDDGGGAGTGMTLVPGMSTAIRPLAISPT